VQSEGLFSIRTIRKGWGEVLETETGLNWLVNEDDSNNNNNNNNELKREMK